MGVLYYAVNNTKRQYYALNKIAVHTHDLETGEDLEFPLQRWALAQSLAMRLSEQDVRRVIDELIALGVEAVYTDAGCEIEDCDDYTLIGAVHAQDREDIGLTRRQIYDRY